VAPEDQAEGHARRAREDPRRYSDLALCSVRLVCYYCSVPRGLTPCSPFGSFTLSAWHPNSAACRFRHPYMPLSVSLQTVPLPHLDWLLAECSHAMVILHLSFILASTESTSCYQVGTGKSGCKFSSFGFRMSKYHFSSGASVSCQ
jgi:hypothetical protein